MSRVPTTARGEGIRPSKRVSGHANNGRQRPLFIQSDDRRSPNGHSRVTMLASDNLRWVRTNNFGRRGRLHGWIGV